MTDDAWFGFHDALIDRFEVDFAARTAVLELQAYAEWPNPPRTRLRITFTGVSNLTASADLLALRDNAFAGQVNQARLADGPGTSHIHLVEGYLAITAEDAPREDVLEG